MRNWGCCLAERDSRLAIALRHTNFGPAQVLGGTPWLLRLWEDAHDRPLGAVITAAVDLARLGADVVSDEVLSAAATAYLRPNARWRPAWYADALTEATELIRGAVSALVPQPDATLTTVVGYRLSDAFRDYGDQHRHWVPVPETTWRALARTGTRSEALTMARRAWKRLLFSGADADLQVAELPNASAALPAWKSGSAFSVSHTSGAALQRVRWAGQAGFEPASRNAAAGPSRRPHQTG